MTSHDLSERPLFFAHVMKTGGGTFRNQILAHVGKERTYPADEPPGSGLRPTFDLDGLARITPERRRRLGAYTGHFPLIARDLIEPYPMTATILRDPVARTLSFLRQCRALSPAHRGLPLTEIYDDRFQFLLFMHNHQAKQFSLAWADEPTSYMDVVDVDEDRLAQAKANLETVEMVGLTEEFDVFVEEACRRLGWAVADVAAEHVTEERVRVPRRLRRRIERDNAADLEFYEFARALVRDRAAR